MRKFPYYSNAFYGAMIPERVREIQNKLRRYGVSLIYNRFAKRRWSVAPGRRVITVNAKFLELDRKTQDAIIASCIGMIRDWEVKRIGRRLVNPKKTKN